MSSDSEEEIAAYKWEGTIQKDVVDLLTKDQTIQDVTQNDINRKLEKKLYMDKMNSSTETRSMIRYLSIIMDVSCAMKNTDMKPTRLSVTKVHLKRFIENYFDQNPLSLISLQSTGEGRASIISDFFWSPSEHIDKLMEMEMKDGDPSLQNSLELVMNQFKEVPKYAFKEVLIIYSSMITWDPSNIFDTIALLKENGVRVSIISLSAAVFILQKICQETSGEFSVAIDSTHYEELLQRNLLPKVSLSVIEERDVLLVKMGFPKKTITKTPVICSCHKLLKWVVFECPKWGSYQWDVPSFCKVWNLMLASSAHLTRTAQHNNPVENFKSAESLEERLLNLHLEVIPSKEVKNGEPIPAEEIIIWSGCEKKLLKEDLKYISSCPKCHNMFCLDCDIFIHETLLSCPMWD